MAISITNLDADASTSNPDDTANLTPTAGSVCFLFVGYAVVGGGTAHPGDSCSVSGAWATWTELAHHHADGNSRRGMFLFRGSGSTANEPISIELSPAAGTYETHYWSVNQVTGHDTGTPNDTPTMDYNASGETVGDIPDVGTLNAGDITLCGFTHETNEAVALEGEGTTYIELSHTGTATGLRTLTVGYSSTDDTPQATWSTSSSWLGMGVIVNAAAGGGGRTTFNSRAFPLGIELGMNLRV